MADSNNSVDFSQKLAELAQLSETLGFVSQNEFRKVFVREVAKLLNAPVCILWEKLPGESKFKIVATYGDVNGEVDKEYQKLELDTAHPSIKRTLDRGDKIWCLPDVSQSASRLVHIDQIRSRKWVSLLSAVVTNNAEAIGALNIFTTETHDFEEWEKNLFKILVDRVAIFLEKERSIISSNAIETDRSRLKSMTSTMRDMNNATSSEEIWNLLYSGISQILKNDSKGDIHIEVAEIDFITGKLNVIRRTNRENYDVKLRLQLREGTISRAIKESRTIAGAHASTSGDYVDIWKDARSEIAIPLVDKALIREGTEVKEGSKKCIGIISIASSSDDAFSDRHIKRIELLASDASIRLERLSFYEKSQKIRDVEQAIGKNQAYTFIMEKIIEAIIKILKFEWVNISLVNSEANIIKSEYLSGIDDKLIEDFKKDAEHRLGEIDIQADIIRNKQIEVPSPNDTRFDSKMYEKYNHDLLIRVFLPIIEPSTNQAIGTVEAGYAREYRQYIYEQDVTIIKSLVDYAAHAIERKKSMLIDKITHELKSPIVGIKGNASFVQVRFSDVRYSPQLIAIKFEDILTDCDLLLYQVRQLEYFLGKISSEKIKMEKTVVFRDIVIKTIYQLKSYLKEEYNFSIEQIHFDRNDSHRIVIFTDKTKLNQVVFNLLINSLKYAENNPTAFKVSIEVDEDRNNFIIKFKDWGIGIKENDKLRVFEEGFRASEAIAKVSGSGLGLNISATIMKQLGGELRLINNEKPTEFHLILPKYISGEDQ